MATKSPGELPFMVAKFRNMLASVCKTSNLHPAIVELILRDVANELHQEAQGYLDEFLAEISQGGESNDNKPD